jgi:hypothetical protein
MDLDGLQDEVDGRFAEEAADQDEKPELEAARPIQAGEPAIEEFLPEGEMPGLDDDQLIQDLLGRRIHEIPDGLVQGEVEELIEDEHPGQFGIVGWRGRRGGHRGGIVAETPRLGHYTVAAAVDRGRPHHFF